MLPDNTRRLLVAGALEDMGSQCTSELVAKVSRMLYIRQLTKTQYHPMCNGLFDRFSGTPKQYFRCRALNVRQIRLPARGMLYKRV